MHGQARLQLGSSSRAAIGRRENLRVVPRAGASSSCAAAPLLRLSGTVASIGPAPVPGLRGPAVLRGGLEANKVCTKSGVLFLGLSCLGTQNGPAVNT
eukprot:1133972-Pelagomonas_calceolata.AAC.1